MECDILPGFKVLKRHHGNIRRPGFDKNDQKVRNPFFWWGLSLEFLSGSHIVTCHPMHKARILMVEMPFGSARCPYILGPRFGALRFASQVEILAFRSAVSCFAGQTVQSGLQTKAQLSLAHLRAWAVRTEHRTRDKPQSSTWQALPDPVLEPTSADRPVHLDRTEHTLTRALFSQVLPATRFSTTGTICRKKRNCKQPGPAHKLKRHRSKTLDSKSSLQTPHVKHSVIPGPSVRNPEV